MAGEGKRAETDCRCAVMQCGRDQWWLTPARRIDRHGEDECGQAQRIPVAASVRDERVELGPGGGELELTG